VENSQLNTKRARIVPRPLFLLYNIKNSTPFKKIETENAKIKQPVRKKREKERKRKFPPTPKKKTYLCVFVPTRARLCTMIVYSVTFQYPTMGFPRLRQFSVSGNQFNDFTAIGQSYKIANKKARTFTFWVCNKAFSLLDIKWHKSTKIYIIKLSLLLTHKQYNTPKNKCQAFLRKKIKKFSKKLSKNLQKSLDIHKKV
jgi:hypothetical protein